MNAPIAFLDCETDGVHPDRKVWEVAVIRREPDGQQTEWQAFVDIDLGDTPDGFGVTVGKFYDRHPLGRHIAHRDDWSLPSWGRKEHMSERDAAYEVAKLTHGATIVGINPSFDTHALERLLRRHGLIPAWDYTPVCAKTWAVGWLVGRGLLDPTPPPWKTGDITEKLRIPLMPDEERHTALGDARLAMRIYDAVVTGPPDEQAAIISPPAVRAAADQFLPRSGQ